ncbi:hypothetical protein [Streptomyces longwoodensis]|uniref:hypothetical protein n=1 Tax=Streptomyces longwoodensis TaxID=68231 RepID=UPI00352D3AA8
MVITIVRAAPARVRKGVRGAVVTDIPAYGCDTRFTVTSGPASTLNSTSNAKDRGPEPGGGACGPTKVTYTTWAGYGSWDGAGGVGGGRWGRVA